MTDADLSTIAAVAGAALLWGLCSKRLERWNITPAMVFVALGALAAAGAHPLVDVSVSSESLRTLAELTLAILLFADASRLNTHRLHHDSGLPARLLLIGLPLTIVAGWGVAAAAFPGIGIWVAATIGAASAPTDLALGEAIVTNPDVPGRIRRVLTVESGLNDGIATPFVTCFLALAVAATETGGHLDIGLLDALRSIGLGIVIGLAVAVGGGWLLRRARRAGWAAPGYLPIAVFSLTILIFELAVGAGGNGFIAAFVGGMAFGATTRGHAPLPAPGTPVPAATDARTDALPLDFTDAVGGLMAGVVWFIFGSTLRTVLPGTTWREVVFAVVSLTAIRMIPVAISLIGARVSRRTVLFVGWSGPRGLATLVFAIIAFDGLPAADGEQLIHALSVTVLLSVLAHGLTAAPLARRYAASEHEEPVESSGGSGDAVAELPRRTTFFRPA